MPVEINSPSFEYYLDKFHEMVNRLRAYYGSEEYTKHLYYLDDQGREALFAAQAYIGKLEKRIDELERQAARGYKY